MSEEEAKKTAEEIFGEKAELSGEEEPEVEEEEAEEEETIEENEIDEEEAEEAEEETDEKLYTVKVDGEEVQVTEDELLKSYSYHQHNVRRAQEISKQEEELLRERARIEQVEKELINMRDNMKTNQGEQYGDGTYLDDVMQYADEPTKRVFRELDSRMARYENDMAALRRDKQQQQLAQTRRQTDRTIDNFIESHPDLGEEDVAGVIKSVLDMGAAVTPKSLDTAYKASIDIDSIKKQAVEEYTKKKKKAAKTTTTSRGKGKANKKKPDVRKMSEAERDAMMAEVFR